MSSVSTEQHTEHSSLQMAAAAAVEPHVGELYSHQGRGDRQNNDEEVNMR
jgi:hypothetical protein